MSSPFARSGITWGYHRRWPGSTWFRRSVTVDAAWCGWVETMNSNEEQVRAAIAEQAGEWFVANDEGPLNARDSAALATWLKTSPVHIEEFLGVSVLGRHLGNVGTDPDFF